MSGRLRKNSTKETLAPERTRERESRISARTMPPGTAIAMVRIVRTTVSTVPSASASAFFQTTDQSRCISPPSRPAEMRKAAIDDVDEPRHREEDEEIDERRDGEDLDRMEALPCHGLRALHVFG